VKGQPNLSLTSSFNPLVDKAVSLITSTKATDEFRKRFGLPAASADANWVQLAVRSGTRSEQEFNDLLPDMLAFHARIAGRMASHLQLTALNISRTQWAAGQMLVTDAHTAQTAAQTLKFRLTTMKPEAMTPFERSISDSPQLIQDLICFAEMASPKVLWRAGVPDYFASWLSVFCPILTAFWTVKGCTGDGNGWR
jgi:hypothetical protein